MDAPVDGPAGVCDAGRPREPDLLRARCHEGNYGLPGQLVGSRIEEQAFAEGRGPDPATRDNVAGGGTAGDPLGR